MRVLMLVPQLPYPPHQGTALRNFNLIAHLSCRHEIHLCCFLPPGRTLEGITPLQECCASITAAPQPTRSMGRRLWTTLTSSRPDMAYRLALPEFKARLRQVLARSRFDVIEFEGIEMIPYLPAVLDQVQGQSPRPCIVFDDHNAEYMLQKRVFESDIGAPRRWPGALYSLIQWKKL
ncbi:MAG: glycosyl transferase family 1, partial [Anaerolineae bacterium]|nr:glycosyl transferase family 1 [Anaerolineae bacterium]